MNNNDTKKVTIPIEKLKTVECPECKGIIFIMRYEIKILPALLSPTGNTQYNYLPVNLCNNCFTKVEIPI